MHDVRFRNLDTLMWTHHFYYKKWFYDKENIKELKWKNKEVNKTIKMIKILFSP